MNNNWIMDVLDDLRQFAGKNGYVKIHEKLEELSEVAAEELAQAARPPARRTTGHATPSRAVSGQSRRCQDPS